MSWNAINGALWRRYFHRLRRFRSRLWRLDGAWLLWATKKDLYHVSFLHILCVCFWRYVVWASECVQVLVVNLLVRGGKDLQSFSWFDCIIYHQTLNVFYRFYWDILVLFCLFILPSPMFHYYLPSHYSHTSYLCNVSLVKCVSTYLQMS